MTENEYIEISNLARLRMIASTMSWLLPRSKEEHAQFAAAQKALFDWQTAIEKRTDGIVTG